MGELYSLKELNNKNFIAFEEDNQLFDILVDDMRLWLYIRFTVYSEMIQLKSNDLIRERKSSITSAKVWNVIKNCTYKNPLLYAKKKNILVFTGQIRNLVDGKYKCRITDDIITSLGQDVCSAELIFELEKGHMEPCSTEHLLRCDYIDVIPALLNPIYRIKYKSDLEKINQICVMLNKKLMDSFGFSLTVDRLISRAQQVFIWFKAKRKLFSNLLRKVSPKVIVEVCSYSVSRMILNEVASQMGITTVELQHGELSTEHLAYNFAKKYSFAALPDYFIAFSEYWKTQASFSQPDERIMPLGFPLFDSMRQKYKHKSAVPNNLRILVVSQAVFTDRLFNDIKTMITQLRAEGRCFSLTYKMHPRESTDTIINDKIWSLQNVNLVSDPSASIYECFSNADIIIGVCSTAIFEGLGYGLHAYVFDYGLAGKRMYTACERKFATAVHDGNEIASYISNSEIMSGCNGEYFFKSDSLRTIVEFLKQLVEIKLVNNEHSIL